MVAKGSLSLSLSLSLLLYTVSLRQKSVLQFSDCLLDVITISQLQRTVHGSAQLIARWHTHVQTHKTCTHQATVPEDITCSVWVTPLNNCLLSLFLVVVVLCVFVSLCMRACVCMSDLSNYLLKKNVSFKLTMLSSYVNISILCND